VNKYLNLHFNHVDCTETGRKLFCLFEFSRVGETLNEYDVSTASALTSRKKSIVIDGEGRRALECH